MNKKIDFTEDEIENVRSIINRYKNSLNDLDRLTLENSKISNELSVVKETLLNIEKEESDLLLKLRSKYGDFPIQILKDYLD